MLEKIAAGVFFYSVSVLEVFLAFFERTHAFVGLGLPLMFMIALNLYLPAWVAAGFVALVIAPAAAAMGTLLVEGLLLSRKR